MITPELVLRAVIAQGISQARHNKKQLDAIFSLRNKLESGGDPDHPLATSKLLHEYLVEYPKIPTNLGYPKASMTRPLISIITGTRSEDNASSQTFGNVGMSVMAADADTGYGFLQEDGTRLQFTVEELGTLLGFQVQITVETTNPTITHLLCEFLFWVLFLAKLRMEHDWGMNDLRLGIQDIDMPAHMTGPDINTRMITVKGDATASVPADGFVGEVDNDDYWQGVQACISEFIVQLVDGTGVMLLDQTNGTVVIE